MVGLSAKTIRFYEEKGIFKPLKRAGNKYRIFLNEDIRKLGLIKAIRELDIPLTDVKKLVEKCGKKLQSRKRIRRKLRLYFICR